MIVWYFSSISSTSLLSLSTVILSLSICIRSVSKCSRMRGRSTVFERSLKLASSINLSTFGIDLSRVFFNTVFPMYYVSLTYVFLCFDKDDI